MAPSKPPPSTADETVFQDSGALLATIKQVITRSTRQCTAPFAPLISAVSIGLREPKDDYSAANQDVEVYIYAPFNGGNTGAIYQRLEGYLHKLQPEEMDRFVRLVDQFRSETADDDDDDEDEFDDGEGERGRSAEIERLKGMLVERDSKIAKLKKQVEQRDAESEDLEEKTAELEKLRKDLIKSEESLVKQAARISVLEEEVGWYHRNPTKTPPALSGNAGNADNAAAAIGARDCGDLGDDAPTSSHNDGPEPSVEGAELPKKPAPRGPTKKPASTMPPFTPMPKITRSSSQATNQSGTSKKPPRKDQKADGSGTYGNGYESHDGEAWGIDDHDPEEPIREARRKSRQANAKGTSDPQTPEDATTSTSAAGESTGMPSGQATKGATGRKQSTVSTKGRKSTDDNVNEADDEYTSDVEEPRKQILKKKRKADDSDEEEMQTTSKKPKRGTKLQSVEEESDNDDKPVHAARRPAVSSGPKANLSRAKASAKRNVARDDSYEFEGGMLNPMFISSAEETDSDIEDED